MSVRPLGVAPHAVMYEEPVRLVGGGPPVVPAPPISVRLEAWVSAAYALVP
jgi:hypothetical protein